MPRSLRNSSGRGGRSHVQLFVSDHPVCGGLGGLRRNFLCAAATPPHEEGITLAQKIFPKNKNSPAIPRILIRAAERCIVVEVVEIALRQGDLLDARGFAANDTHRARRKRLRRVNFSKQIL